MQQNSVNDFVSSHIDKFTIRDIGTVADKLPQFSFWHKNFALNRTLRNSPPDQHAGMASMLLRKIFGAISDYDSSSAFLKTIGPKVKYDQYFTLLDRLETCVYKLYTAMDVARKAGGIQLFTTGDGTPEQRLNELYNKCKHEIPDAFDVIWLDDEGLSCATAKLKFAELRMILTDYGALIEKMLSV